MPSWIYSALTAVLLWGIVGIFQKLGAARISADSLLVWVTAGYVLALPWLVQHTHLAALPLRDLALGAGVGFINGLGAWFLFAALEKGGRASIVIPFTGLYPLVTLILAATFLGENLSLRQCAGLVLAIVASAMLSVEAPAAGTQ